MAQVMRTPGIARSIVILLASALVLLLVVNFSTFVMIQRTAVFNDRVEHIQMTRRSARTLLISMIDAETGQRGFLLTGRPTFLAPYSKAVVDSPEVYQGLISSTDGDAATEASAQSIIRLSRTKLAEMEATLVLARTGQIGQAIQQVRGGEGQRLMDELRTEVMRFDTLQGERQLALTAVTERSATLTVLVNAIAGVLILVLAGIIALLVRRYINDMAEARTIVDRTNAGLEQTVRDRTAALTRANEEVQRFAYIVSHDLRSPLVNVMGFTSELETAGQVIDRQMTVVETEAPGLIESDALTAVREDMPEAVAFIRASTEKMDRLINAILKLSREGRRNLVPETLDMTALAQGIANSVRHQVDSTDGTITVEDLPAFESDRLSIDQILGNIVDNAVKYLDPSRPAEIVVSGEDLAGGWVRYSVADNGRGIAPRDHERVFELFRRAGRQDRPGEGLGLAFVRNSVRRLGGTIEIESELGKGSTFHLKFPKRLILDESGDTL